MADVAEYFNGKEIAEICSGTRLNNSDKFPYIKKRLNGSGGYRIYFLVLIQDENVFLIFIHPKTGPDGAENISDKAKAKYYKDVLEAIKVGNLLEVSTSNRTLSFSPLQNTDKWKARIIE
ncbi:MAG: hypothetical protein MUC87_02505 [Bacteroidia bacterium]|jgi:hypothetical protein|nr:hypothetical protein [Bacteroidia bacterium]